MGQGQDTDVARPDGWLASVDTAMLRDRLAQRMSPARAEAAIHDWQRLQEAERLRPISPPARSVDRQS
jgi:hypothetical protein